MRWWQCPDPILVAGWRPGGLAAPEKRLLGQSREGAIHRLNRDRTNLRSAHNIGRQMRFIRDHPQNGQPLRRNPKSALTKEVGPIDRHVANSGKDVMTQRIESFDSLACGKASSRLDRFGDRRHTLTVADSRKAAWLAGPSGNGGLSWSGRP
jgi:hypothetical protein